MKKTNILLSSLIYCINAWAQHHPIDEIVYVKALKLPVEAKIIGKDKLKSAIKRSTKWQRIDSNLIGTFFKVNNILIYLNGVNANISQDYLEQTKRGADGLERLEGRAPSPA